MSALPAPPTERRPDLDWLRVVAILLLHLFHTGMMFNTWEWHLKNPEPLPALEPPMVLLHLVRMPLLMLVAGVGTAFALRRRSLGAFAKDRVKRLLLPLAFGMLVVVPPQIYVERRFQGAFDGSYLDFYPSVFALVPYPEGSFSWHHLWFVAYLLLYCLLALPLFAGLSTRAGEALRARLEAWLARGWPLVLLFLPLAAVQLLLRGYPETHALLDDPRTLSYYGLLFLYGHLLGRCPAVWERLAASRRRLLALTLALFAAMVPPWEYPFPLEQLGATALVWCILLTALGYARAHIRVRRPWLAHAQGLAYPFYILHQTVILLAGAALLPLPLGPWSRFALVLLLSFAATWGLCEGAARVAWLRPLLGMGPAGRRAAKSPAALEVRHPA